MECVKQHTEQTPLTHANGIFQLYIIVMNLFSLRLRLHQGVDLFDGTYQHVFHTRFKSSLNFILVIYESLTHIFLLLQKLQKKQVHLNPNTNVMSWSC